MPYFDKYLKNENYDVKIIVSSDISVFEWVLSYAEACFYSKLPSNLKDEYNEIENKKLPYMNLHKLSAVLNSAEYLSMDKLIK